MALLKLLLYVHLLWTFNHQCPDSVFSPQQQNFLAQDAKKDRDAKHHFFFESKAMSNIAQNKIPFRLKTGLRVFPENIDVVINVWKRQNWRYEDADFVHFQYNRVLLYPFHSFM